MDDIVKITQYITDLAYRPLVAGPRDQYLGTPGPASTLVVVKGLAAPDYLVEIEALAILDELGALGTGDSISPATVGPKCWTDCTKLTENR